MSHAVQYISLFITFMLDLMVTGGIIVQPFHSYKGFHNSM